MPVLMLLLRRVGLPCAMHVLVHAADLSAMSNGRALNVQGCIGLRGAPRKSALCACCSQRWLASLPHSRCHVMLECWAGAALHSSNLGACRVLLMRIAHAYTCRSSKAEAVLPFDGCTHPCTPGCLTQCTITDCRSFFSGSAVPGPGGGLPALGGASS